MTEGPEQEVVGSCVRRFKLLLWIHYSGLQEASSDGGVDMDSDNIAPLMI